MQRSIMDFYRATRMQRICIARLMIWPGFCLFVRHKPVLFYLFKTLQQRTQAARYYMPIKSIITSTASEGADGYPHMPILRPLAARRFVRFLASGGAKFPKMGDSLPRKPLNQHAKFDAAILYPRRRNP